MKPFSRFPLILAAVMAAFAFGGSPAMAAKGSCNPAPDPYHVKQYAKADGAVFVEVGYGWDGVSVYPNCVGPIVGARVTNTSSQDWYAKFPNARGGTRTITIAANTTRTYSASQLASVGLVTLEDIAAFQLSPTP